MTATKFVKTSPLFTLLSAGLLLLTTFFAAPVKAAETEKAEEAKVYHTVIFWLKPETPAATVAEIKKSVKGLEKLSMVEKVLVGGPIMSDRDVVDDSFSVAFTMVFKDEAALQAYNTDPDHKKSSQRTMPHVARGVIYDYKSD